MDNSAFPALLEFKNKMSPDLQYWKKDIQTEMKRVCIWKEIDLPPPEFPKNITVKEVCFRERSIDSTLYKQIVGILRYLYHSRPGIAYGVGIISIYMSNSRVSHMATAKRILRYVKGILDYGLLYPRPKPNQSVKLIGFLDADWSGDIEDSKSTTGYIVKLFGSTIWWSSKK
ncbi:uncharacterized protein LOC113874860 [Abrus precatorius]|uniref:Uncharacterized protein LOC113874860 n=1 Tax=Abrus precatorius TaxID=3816 RepID=A0A8B8MLV3_ABRPR|nr:uncharacterized protein LOC113874860 [Abrus precatorius]